MASKQEIENDIRRLLQNEFYLEGKSDSVAARMQDLASKYVADKYPEVRDVSVKVNWFGETEIVIR